MVRICIYPQDVQIILGKSPNYCRKLIRDIKKYYHKEKHQVVSVEEFFEFTGLAPQKVYEVLK